MSNLFTLNWKDFLKGLLMAVLAPVIAIIYQSVELGSLTFDWSTILKASLLAGLAYIMKNFLTDSNGKFFGKDEEDIGGGGIKNPKP